jgi:hypothetical protein
MKLLILLTLGFLAAACGKGGDIDSDDKITAPVSTEKDCMIQILGTEENKDIILKANRMRTACGLTEDELMKLLR